MAEALKSLRDSRWREFHCLAAPRVVLQVARRALASRVIPPARESAGRMARQNFRRSTPSRPKFSRSLNSFHDSGFCICSFGLWLRFGVPKSENQFVAAALTSTIGLVHEVENFENRKFAQKLKLWHV